MMKCTHCTRRYSPEFSAAKHADRFCTAACEKCATALQPLMDHRPDCPSLHKKAAKAIAIPNRMPLLVGA